MSSARRAACAALLLWVPAPAVPAATGVIDPLTAGEPLVLTFRQGRTRLAEGVLGFRDDAGKIFLPLGEVSRGIGLAIRVDPAARRAEGFYLDQEKRFRLDLDQGVVDSAGRTFAIDEGTVAVSTTDLFVELSRLNAWLADVGLAYHEAYLLVEVTSDPPLPKLQRQRRDGVRQGMAASRSGRNRLELPRVTTPYRLFGPPVIDVDANFEWSDTSAGSSSIGLRGVGDMVGMGARWFVGLGHEMELREARIALGRKDPAGDLLGPLGLTELELGDVGQFGTPLISRGLRGAGIRLTNRRWEVTSGTAIDLRGELPLGWEAELYRGDLLVGFDVEPERGEYVFDDVPLLPGINELTVVRHGPQGQRDETTRVVRLGGHQPAPGTWYGEVSALLQQQDAVALADRRDDGAGLGAAADHGGTGAAADRGRTGAAADRGRVAAEARFVFGLRPGVSATASWNTLSVDGERVGFAGLSTELSLAGVGLKLDGALDRQGHWAAGGRMIATVADWGIVLQHEEFGARFRSPASGGERPLASRSQLRVNGQLELPGSGLPIRAFLRGEAERGLAAGSRMAFTLGSSARLGGLQLNKQITGTLTRKTGGQDLVEVDGRLNLALRRRRARLRGGLAYAVAPTPRLASLSLQAGTRFRDTGLETQATLGHEFDGASSIGLGVGWSLPRVELSTRLTYRTSGAVTAAVGVRCSLDWRDRRARPSVDRRPRTSQGLARVRVFVDRDRDGRPSPGDESLAGVRFTPGSRQQRTDDHGRVTLSGFPELRPTDVLLHAETLPDPFLRPAVAGYRVSVRPGAQVELAFPVVWVSDVEGTVLVDEATVSPDGTSLGRRVRGLGNVEIVLLDGEDREVRRRRSEFDGFFAFSNLPSGSYRLRIAADQADRFDLDDGGGAEVTLRDDTAILAGVELRLVSSRPFVVRDRPAEDG